MLYLLKALESLIMTDSDKFEKKSLKIFATVFYQMLMDYFSIALKFEISLFLEMPRDFEDLKCFSLAFIFSRTSQSNHFVILSTTNLIFLKEISICLIYVIK